MRYKTVILCACAALISLASGASRAETLEERITLTTEDGWNLNARYLKASEGAPTVVFIHTQKSDLTEWESWFKPMKRYGFGYLAHGPARPWQQLRNAGRVHHLLEIFRDKRVG